MRSKQHQLSVADRVALGRAERRVTPGSSHAVFEPAYPEQNDLGHAGLRRAVESGRSSAERDL